MLWNQLAAICGGAEGAASLLGLFLAGLAGSPLHCAPMCGPFVLARAAGRMASLPATRLCERQRLMSGALLPYHLGRIGTYAALGALAAGLGAGLRGLPWLGGLSGVLLAVAGTVLLLRAVTRLAPALAVPWHAGGLAWAGGLGTRLGSWFARPRAGGDFLFGAALGLLPCGFLYTALAIAAAQANPVAGALAMAAFGLGTAPALIGVGCAGGQLARALPPRLHALAPALLGGSGLLLVVLGLRALVRA